MNITKFTAPTHSSLSVIWLQIGVRHAVMYMAKDVEGNYEFGRTPQEARLKLRSRYRRIHGDARFNPNSII